LEGESLSETEETPEPQASEETPINSPEVETAVENTGEPEVAGEMEASDEAAAADNSIGEGEQQLEDEESVQAAVTSEPEPGEGKGFVASDGAVLGRDFVIPGVGPGDNDP
jgi:hypothetical protein